MAINMPASPNFTACRFGLETNTRRFESPITKAVQRVLLDGARWVATYTLPSMNRNQVAAWQAFLLLLDGSVNTFNGYDPDARTPRGLATGLPLVKGGSQTGSSLAIDGCTASVTGWLKAGDYFSVGGKMKQLTADCNTNISGETTLFFKPAIFTAPADNAPLTVTNVTCEMILLDDKQAIWDTGNKMGIYNPISFSAIETFT